MALRTVCVCALPGADGPAASEDPGDAIQGTGHAGEGQPPCGGFGVWGLCTLLPFRGVGLLLWPPELPTPGVGTSLPWTHRQRVSRATVPQLTGVCAMRTNPGSSSSPPCTSWAWRFSDVSGRCLMLGRVPALLTGPGARLPQRGRPPPGPPQSPGERPCCRPSSTAPKAGRTLESAAPGFALWP